MRNKEKGLLKEKKGMLILAFDTAKGAGWRGFTNFLYTKVRNCR
jgi:hypothetical protein